MYKVYVLKSVNNKWFYIGLSRDPQSRLLEHNSGQVRSTKYRKPYIIIYTSKLMDRLAARDLEKYLKVASNKEKLLTKLGY